MSRHEQRASLLDGGNVDYSVNHTPFAQGGYFAQQQPYTKGASVQDGYAQGGYHEREGYATGSGKAQGSTSLFFLPDSKWQWSFVATVLAQAIVCLGLESYIFGKFQLSLMDDASSHTVPTYLSLFIFGFLYQLVLSYDALRMQNTIEIFGLCLYNIGLLVESATQFHQIHDAVEALTSPTVLINPEFWATIQPSIIAVPCVLGLGTIFMAFIAWKLNDEFAWSIYKHISADLRLRRRFLSYQIYITLLKFDFFFFLAFTVQFLVVVSHTGDLEFGLTIAAIPITILVLILAAFWVKKENFFGMAVVVMFYFAGLAYFLFKLVRIYNGPPDRIQDYLPARTALTIFAVLTVLLLVVTIGYAIICTINFDKGLKPLVNKSVARQRPGSSQIDRFSNHVPLGSPDARMTIE